MLPTSTFAVHAHASRSSEHAAKKPQRSCAEDRLCSLMVRASSNTGVLFLEAPAPLTRLHSFLLRGSPNLTPSFRSAQGALERGANGLDMTCCPPPTLSRWDPAWRLLGFGVGALWSDCRLNRSDFWPLNEGALPPPNCSPGGGTSDWKAPADVFSFSSHLP